MRGAKQVQMSRSPITFFCHRSRRFVSFYLFHFLSYHFETWKCCSCAYKECLCSFSMGENEYVVVFLFPCWRRYCPLLARSSGVTGGTTCPVILCELCAWVYRRFHWVPTAVICHAHTGQVSPTRSTTYFEVVSALTLINLVYIN